ncbi:MAG: hypothetical protein HY720_25825 [Planctomycetes bacterium]|nr:hypothetical protein [Planctomycetota bacterium]
MPPVASTEDILGRFATRRIRRAISEDEWRALLVEYPSKGNEAVSTQLIHALYWGLEQDNRMPRDVANDLEQKDRDDLKSLAQATNYSPNPGLRDTQNPFTPVRWDLPMVVGAIHTSPIDGPLVTAWIYTDEHDKAEEIVIFGRGIGPTRRALEDVVWKAIVAGCFGREIEQVSLPLVLDGVVHIRRNQVEAVKVDGLPDPIYPLEVLVRDLGILAGRSGLVRVHRVGDNARVKVVWNLQEALKRVRGRGGVQEVVKFDTGGGTSSIGFSHVLGFVGSKVPIPKLHSALTSCTYFEEILKAYADQLLRRVLESAHDRYEYFKAEYERERSQLDHYKSLSGTLKKAMDDKVVVLNVRTDYDLGRTIHLAHPRSKLGSDYYNTDLPHLVETDKKYMVEAKALRDAVDRASSQETWPYLTARLLDMAVRGLRPYVDDLPIGGFEIWRARVRPYLLDRLRPVIAGIPVKSRRRVFFKYWSGDGKLYALDPCYAIDTATCSVALSPNSVFPSLDEAEGPRPMPSFGDDLELKKTLGSLRKDPAGHSAQSLLGRLQREGDSVLSDTETESARQALADERTLARARALRRHHAWFGALRELERWVTEPARRDQAPGSMPEIPAHLLVMLAQLDRDTVDLWDRLRQYVKAPREGERPVKDPRKPSLTAQCVRLAGPEYLEQVILAKTIFPASLAKPGQAGDPGRRHSAPGLLKEAQELVGAALILDTLRKTVSDRRLNDVALYWTLARGLFHSLLLGWGIHSDETQALLDAILSAQHAMQPIENSGGTGHE